MFLGTNAPLVTYAAGLPELTTNTLQVLSGALFTDGNGRIDGLLYARFYFGAAAIVNGLLLLTGLISLERFSYGIFDPIAHYSEELALLVLALASRADRVLSQPIYRDAGLPTSSCPSS